MQWIRDHVSQGNVLRHHSEAAGVDVRSARAGEGPSFDRLVDLAGVAAETDLIESIEDSSAADLLLHVSRSGDRNSLRSSAAQVMEPHQLVPFFRRVSLPLLAVHPTEGPVGALQGIVPGNVATQCLESGWPPSVVASLAIRVAKIAAVAVQPSSSRQGVGHAMLDTACSIYFDAGYRLVYGYIRPQDAHLHDFYRGAGFDLPTRPISVGLASGAVVDIQTDPNSEQQMFALTLDAWKKRALP